MKKLLTTLLFLFAIASLNAQTAVSSFPWAYGFEDTDWLSWQQESISGTGSWEATGIGIPSANSGTGLAYFIGMAQNNVRRLTLPKFDFSDYPAGTATLSFFYSGTTWQSTAPDRLIVYYKAAAADEWVFLDTIFVAGAKWEQTTINLPNLSDDYYISFVSGGHGGMGMGVAIDDVSVKTPFPWKYGFEDTRWLSSPWNQESVSGTGSWEATGTGIPSANSGTGLAYFIGMGPNNVRRLILPKFDFSDYPTGIATLSFFYSGTTWQSTAPDRLIVYYKAAAANEWVFLDTIFVAGVKWEQTTINLPNLSDDYYISFVSGGHGGMGMGVAIDDIEVSVAVALQDLKLIATPYSQMPIDQFVASPFVENIGEVTMTGVRLTVSVNGANISSATIPSIAPGGRARFDLGTSVPIALGEQTIKLTVTANQTDHNPNDNTLEYVVQGNFNRLVQDFPTTGTPPSVMLIGQGHPTMPLSPPFGNIFEITQTTTLAAIEFNAMMGGAYDINLYRVNDDLTLQTPPLVQSGAFAPDNAADALNTVLTPGRYFAALTLSQGMMAMLYRDNNPASTYYVQNGITIAAESDPTGMGTNPTQPHVGALAIRLIMHVDHCPEPENLTVTDVDYLTARFSWDGWLSQYAVMLHDTDRDDTIIWRTTYKNSWSDNDPMANAFNPFPILKPGTNYHWSIIGYCTETVVSIVEGTPFTTISCDATPSVINVFPWEYDFEDVEWQYCWEQEATYTRIFQRWKRAEGLDIDGAKSPRSGQYNALRNSGGDNRKLITPRIDFTDVTNTTLSFWYLMPITNTCLGWNSSWDDCIGGYRPDQDTLRVYYKTSANGDWVLLADYQNPTSSWTQVTLNLPNTSADYYIAFESAGVHNYSKGIGLDALVINGVSRAAGITALVAPQSGNGMTATETVTATVRNLGTDTIKDLKVTLAVNGSIIVTNDVVQLDPNQQVNHTFTETINLYSAATKTFEVKIWTTLPNGKITSEDTLTRLITKTVVMDAGIEQNGLIAPVTTGGLLSDQEAVTVKIGNYGSYEVTNLPVYVEVNDVLKLSDVVPGPIAPGNFVEFTFTGTVDLSAHGLHYVKVFTSLDHDQVRANDTLVDLLISGAAIDAGVAAIIAPTSGTGLTETETVTIRVTNFSSNTITELPVAYRINNGTPVWDTIKATILPGHNYEHSFSTKANLTSVITGSFDITAYTSLDGDDNSANDTVHRTVVNTVVNHARVTAIVAPISGTGLSANETVRITVRNDGTYPISSLPVAYKVDGGAEVLDTIKVTIAPTASHTFTFAQTANLSSTVTKTFVIQAYPKLSMEGAINGDTTRNVINTVRADATVLSILEPNSGHNLTATEKITARVTYSGLYAASSIPITYRIGSQTPVVAEIPGPISSGDTVEYTFTQTADLSANGTYNITVWVALPGDIDRRNDTSSKAVVNTVTSSIEGVVVEQTDVRLYPNPTADRLFIQTADAVRRIEIFNIQGLVLKVISTNVTEISVEDLTAGTYIIKITTDRGVATRRIVKR